MASGTRSKVASSSISLSDDQDISESMDNDSRRQLSKGDRSSLFKNKSNEISSHFSGDNTSVILQTSCGLLYPVPRSIRSPQIEIYQSGLRSLTLVNFRSATDIAQWLDKFLEHAMLINMHEFFYWTCNFCTA